MLLLFFVALAVVTLSAWFKWPVLSAWHFSWFPQTFWALLCCCSYFYACLFIFSNWPPRNFCHISVLLLQWTLRSCEQGICGRWELICGCIWHIYACVCAIRPYKLNLHSFVCVWAWVFFVWFFFLCTRVLSDQTVLDAISSRGYEDYYL